MITKEDMDAFDSSLYDTVVGFSGTTKYNSLNGLNQMYDYYDEDYEQEFDYMLQEKTLEDFAEECHLASYNNGWWHDPDTGQELPTEGFLGAHVIGCKLGLIHSEVSEVMEGHRKSLKDDKLPEYDAMDVELVDVLIRVFDLMGQRKKPYNEIYKKKMAFNDVRPDHALENRRKGGKLY